MKRFVKNITTYFVLFLFAFSYAGININIHHCTTCSTEKYYLFFHPDCCHEHAHEHDNIACCSINTPFPEKKEMCSNSHSNCCYDTSLYLKLDDEFLGKSPSKIYETSTIFLFLLPNTYNSDIIFDFYPYIGIYDPPPKFSGVNLLAFLSQFIFYDIS